MTDNADYIVKRLSCPTAEHAYGAAQNRWLPLVLVLIATNVVLWLFHVLFD